MCPWHFGRAFLAVLWEDFKHDLYWFLMRGK